MTIPLRLRSLFGLQEFKVYSEAVHESNVRSYYGTHEGRGYK